MGEEPRTPNELEQILENSCLEAVAVNCVQIIKTSGRYGSTFHAVLTTDEVKSEDCDLVYFKVEAKKNSIYHQKTVSRD